MEKGYLTLVLHAHLPFVKHPEYEDFLEERWLYEAITETYLPILNYLDKLVEDKVDFNIAMSLTPPLCEMLADPLLMSRYERHLNKLIELSEKEIKRTKNNFKVNEIAKFYEKRFKHYRYLFIEKYKKNLIAGFRRVLNTGKLEIITCAATHGFLPLMNSKNAIRAQLKVGVNNYKKHFGRLPKGIWLPECAYYKGVEYYLKELKIKYFFVDTHGILYARPRPRYGIHAPVYTKCGVAAFARDNETSKQVWSALEGYPGDGDYREFYRDVGFDLNYNYIKPYIHESGLRLPVGIKYHRITNKRAGLNRKRLYNVKQAFEKAAAHAGNFMFNRQNQIKYLRSIMDRKPIVVSPYDAELFGHWWYEGPEFLNYLIRKIAYDQKDIKLITPSKYLREYKKNQVVNITPSSWGNKGYYEVWLNSSNHWIYPHLHKAADRMEYLAKTYKRTSGLLKRALNQAGRELLLAQSSDWAFIMTTKTTVKYAVKRTKDHIERFTNLYFMIKANKIDIKYLSDLEYKDSIFSEIDYRVWA